MRMIGTKTISRKRALRAEKRKKKKDPMGCQRTVLSPLFQLVRRSGGQVSSPSHFHELLKNNLPVFLSHARVIAFKSDSRQDLCRGQGVF